MGTYCSCLYTTGAANPALLAISGPRINERINEDYAFITDSIKLQSENNSPLTVDIRAPVGYKITNIRVNHSTPEIDINGINSSLGDGQVVIFDFLINDPQDCPGKAYWQEYVFNVAIQVDCTNTAPASPALLVPADGADFQYDQMNFIWNELSDWGTNCSGNDNYYRFYLEKMASIDTPCPDFATLMVNAQDKVNLDGDDDTDPDTFVENLQDNLKWESKYCWGVKADNGALPADSPIWSFIITYPQAWFQTQGGDVYGQSGISSSIPDSVPSASKFFSLALDGYSGLISSPNSRNFGEGTATQSNDNDWSLDGSAQAVTSRYSYSYFAHQVDTACQEGEGDNNSFNSDVNCLYDKVNVSPPLPGITVYNVDNQNISLSGDTWDIGNDTTIVFVNFDSSEHTLFIDEDITVGPSGFFALITNGNMEIKQGTGDVQGVYIADGQIETDTDTTKFIGQGIFYAKSGFDLNRDLEVDNATYPAELFLFDPQYLFTAPRVFRKKPYLWREVVP